MSKRFTLALGALVGLTALLAACSGGDTGNNPEQPGLEGEAQVSVKGLSIWEIETIVVTAQPANVSRTLTYSPETGTFTGTLVLPTGTQTLTANGYAYVASDGGTPDGGPPMDAGVNSDAGSTNGMTLVATGTATVTIVANTTTAASIRVYDLTPPLPQPDIAPLIRSVTASSVNTTVNQAISLSVVAVDLDNDPLSYSWTSDCLGSSFSSPTSANTFWASSVAAACNLTVTVTARGQSVSESLGVVVFANNSDAGTGGVQVSGEYIPRPYVSAMSISGNELQFGHYVYRSNSANLPAVRPGQTYSVEFFGELETLVGVRSTNLEATCGTLRRNFANCTNTSSCHVGYSWTTPNMDAACRLTATITNDTLTDSFSAGIVVK